MYHWLLSMASFRFCETYLLHIKLFVGNNSVISPFLGSVWGDSSMCVPWLFCMCAMTLLHICNDSSIRSCAAAAQLHLCAAWLIHMCAMTLLYVCNDSFICGDAAAAQLHWCVPCLVHVYMIWPVHMCAMTRSYVCADSFICVPDSFVWVLRLIHRSTPR